MSMFTAQDGGPCTATSTLLLQGSDGGGPMAWEAIPSGTSSGQAAMEGEVDVATRPPCSVGLQSHCIVDNAAGRDLSPHHGADKMEESMVHDGKFYIEGADCVIRVDNTLFKVHRYLLARDSSAFQDMFNMPVQNHVLSQNVEGGSDENPIRLYGESAERFRALLSLIYKLPLQLQICNTPAADVDWLLTVAEVTNKYHFVSTETWAVNALHTVISGLQGPPQPQYDLGHCSSAWMKRLLEIALLCGHSALRDYVVERWIDRIVVHDLRPIHALDVADRNDIRRLQGYAYYVQLLEMDDNFEPGVAEDGKQYSRALTIAGPDGQSTSTSTQPGTPTSLTCKQRERLLFGHWSLSRLWNRLQMIPPEFQQADECIDHEGCMSTWTEVWREVGRSEATLKHPVEDVPGRLRDMEQQLLMYADMHIRLWRGMAPQCRWVAVMALKTTITEVQESLADHFVHTRGDGGATNDLVLS